MFSRRAHDLKKSLSMQRQLTLILFLVSFYAVAISVQASEVVLEEIKISAKGDDTVIDIDLGIPLNYSKHFPHSEGEILQIQMILDSEDERVIHKEVRQGEDLKPPPGKEPILIYVTYEEGVPGGPYLTLRFARQVKFEVNAGQSVKGLSIKILGEPQAKVAADMKKAPVEDKMTKKKLPEDGDRRKGPSVDQLMAKARQSLTFGDNSGAITLLRKIIAMPESAHTQDARELLGLALERDRQIPRAKFEYKKYLRLYKEGEGPKRVQQRLTALQSIGIEKRQRLRVPENTRRKQDDSYKVFGRLSQSYDYRLIQQLVGDDEETATETELKTLSQRFDTHLNVRGRYRDSERSIQIIGAGNYSLDFEEGDPYHDTGRVSDLAVDYDEFKKGFTATLGRQRASNTGLLGRFDGVMMGYEVTSNLKPYVFAGKPVFFSDPGYEQRFIGAKLDYGKKKSPLGGNIYITQQDVKGKDEYVSDRQGVGATMFYSDKAMSVFGMVDYDVLFQRFTTYNFRWGWSVSNKMRLNVSYNYRWFLTKSTAQSGQTLPIEEIEKLLGEEETIRLAMDKTSKSYNVTVGGSYQIDKDKQVTLDVSQFKTYGLVERVLDTDGLNNTFASESSELSYYSLQWISSNTFAINDLYVVGLRYSDSSTNDEAGLYLNTRFPPYNKYNIRPGLNITNRTFKNSTTLDDGATRRAITPSIKIDYRAQRQWVIETELGYEWVNYYDTGIPNPTLDTQQAVFRLGYHYTF